MARSDLLINLIRSKNLGDERLFLQTVEAIIAEERAKQHHTFANQLTSELNSAGKKNKDKRDGQVISHASHLQSALFETLPQKRIDDLVLSDDIVATFEELIEEQQRVELLRSYNLEPRHRLLISGPPGNGKTSLAEAIAESLSIPFISIRYEGLITSFLGETNQKLKQIFDYVKTQRCVLFFDEFDTVGKERGDEHETGEIKRVVSSLLMQIDSLPSHVVIIAASNHPELLDRAASRRFQIKMSLNKPDSKQISKVLSHFEEKSGISFGKDKKSLSLQLVGLPFSEIENFCLSIMRRYVLEQPGADLNKIIKRQLSALDIPRKK